MYSVTSLPTSTLLAPNLGHGNGWVVAVVHAILKYSTRHSGGRLQESLMDVDEAPSGEQSGTGGATVCMHV